MLYFVKLKLLYTLKQKRCLQYQSQKYFNYVVTSIVQIYDDESKTWEIDN